MPHLSLECAVNIEFEVQSRLARLHEAMVATGAVNLKGLKNRVIRHTDYRMADGCSGCGFVHLNILVNEGRPLGIRQEMTRRTMDVLEQIFGHQFAEGYLSLSVDLEEMVRGIARTHHNIPVEGIRP